MVHPGSVRPLSPPPRRPSGRQRLAILFVDISGFTRLVDTAPPETVYEVVRPLLDELVVLVRLHDGEVQQVLGDGFMCAFGLQGQDGREAERAVDAALALAATGASGRHPPVHVGVEYGEVLVTPSWEPAGYGVWGRPVNLARRLCELAGPGGVWIGPDAYAHTRQGDSWRAVPARLRLKGLSGEVLAHAVTATSDPAFAAPALPVSG